MTAQQPVYIRLTIKDMNERDEVFFSNEDETVDSIEIIPGTGQFFPKIDAMLPSMKVGERKVMTLETEDAFGEKMEEAIKKVPVDALAEELRKPGTPIVTQLDDDTEVQGMVISADDEFVVIDFNHPLAGKKIEVAFVIVEK